MRRFLLLAVFASCSTVPLTPARALEALRAQPKGYLSGKPVGLRDRRVFNREDFVYDAKLSPRGDLLATSRLGPQSFHLALHDVSTGTRRFDPPINPLEMDVDAVEFSPDGTQVAAVSRDGSVRIYRTDTGAFVAAWLTDEPLVTLAWHPNGTTLALGGAKGLITVLATSPLGHQGDLRVHTDEVRSLAFTPEGALITASWDRSLAVLTSTPESGLPKELRVHAEKQSGLWAFKAVLDGRAVATVALDARLPGLVITGALAQALGIELTRLDERVTVATAFGPQQARVAHGHSLGVKGLTWAPLDLLICDGCVPAPAQAAWGGAQAEQLAPSFDAATSELVLITSGLSSLVQARPSARWMVDRRFTFPAPLNDLSLDAAGQIAGVAFSETKSQRTKAIYDREKRGEIEPERPWDCAARIDLSTGKVLEQVHGHHGVVATAGISPDGQTLITGGWDRRVVLHGPSPEVVDADFGWSLRRVRFSADGRFVSIAAWTPQNPLGNHSSDPSAVVSEVTYGEDVQVISSPSPQLQK